MSFTAQQFDALLAKTRTLMQEMETLRSAMSTVPAQVPVPVVAPAPLVASPIAESLSPGEKPKRKLNISAKGMEAKVAAGKKLAALNAIRKEFMQNAKLNGEW